MKRHGTGEARHHCGVASDDGEHSCVRLADHDGPHKCGPRCGFTWPMEAAT